MFLFIDCIFNHLRIISRFAFRIETIDDDLDEFIEQDQDHCAVIAESLYAMNEAVRDAVIARCKVTVLNKSSWRWLTNLFGSEYVEEIQAELATANIRQTWGSVLQ